MHIPDGYLSTPVWAALDAVAVPVVAVTAQRAKRGLNDDQIPLLGVLGAFIFAAQMVNFPVGPGTSGHLVGGALLAYTVGPAAASVVMTAILIIQALVFQDGGVLALGANIVNMAIMGVLAGYLPFLVWGRGRWRKSSLFAGGFISVLVSACLALAELLLSGVRIPSAALEIALALFAVSAVLEGAITLAVVEALEQIHPRRRHPAAPRWTPARATVALTAVVLASVGVLFASAAPDGIQRLGLHTGLGIRGHSLFRSPLSDYQAAFVPPGFWNKTGAGLLGLLLVYAACLAILRWTGRRRSA